MRKSTLHKFVKGQALSIAVAALGLFFVCCAWGQGKPLEENSPFIWPGFTPAEDKNAKAQAGAQPPAEDLEFRGVYSLDSEYRFNIFSKSGNKGTWYRLNMMDNNILVQHYDPSNDSITLLFNGTPKQLTMVKPSNTPMEVKTAPGNAPTATPPPAVRPSAPGQPPAPPQAPPAPPAVRRRIVRPPPAK